MDIALNVGASTPGSAPSPPPGGPGAGPGFGDVLSLLMEGEGVEEDSVLLEEEEGGIGLLGVIFPFPGFFEPSLNGEEPADLIVPAELVLEGAAVDSEPTLCVTEPLALPPEPEGFDELAALFEGVDIEVIPPPLPEPCLLTQEGLVSLQHISPTPEPQSYHDPDPIEEEPALLCVSPLPQNNPPSAAEPPLQKVSPTSPSVSVEEVEPIGTTPPPSGTVEMVISLSEPGETSAVQVALSLEGGKINKGVFTTSCPQTLAQLEGGVQSLVQELAQEGVSAQTGDFSFSSGDGRGEGAGAGQQHSEAVVLNPAEETDSSKAATPEKKKAASGRLDRLLH